MWSAAIPDEITQKVINALQKHLEEMKKGLDEQIHGTEEKVTQKITGIDSKRPSKLLAAAAKEGAAATAPAAAPAKGKK